MTDTPLKTVLPEMTEGPLPEADPRHNTDRLTEIARMADLLTDRLLNDQIMGRPVSTEGIRALLGASSLLKDYGQAIPPLLGQIVQDFGDLDQAQPAKRLEEADLEGAERLARSLSPFRGSNGPKS